VGQSERNPMIHGLRGWGLLPTLFNLGGDKEIIGPVHRIHMHVQVFRIKASDVPWRQESDPGAAVWTFVLAEYDSFMQCKLFIYMARFNLLPQIQSAPLNPYRSLY
jgi:hypothetical protein